MVVGTKVRLISEGVSRPSIALRFATKLPMASNESGLGPRHDRLLLRRCSSPRRCSRCASSATSAWGSSATRRAGDRQNDVLTYGLSFARAVTQRGEVVGEINGRKDTREGDPPPGTESRSMLRFGARYTDRRAGALTRRCMFGVTSNDPSVGFTAGFTYVFDAFQVP